MRFRREFGPRHRSRVGYSDARMTPTATAATARGPALRDPLPDGTYPSTCWECGTVCGSLVTVGDGKVTMSASSTSPARVTCIRRDTLSR